MSESTHEASLITARRHDQHSVAPPSSPVQDNASTSSTLQQQDVGTASNQALEAVKDVVFGSTAGMVGKVIEYPFDTVKVRLQSSTRYAGPLDCFAQSIRAEGIAGLYRGISAPLVGAAVEMSTMFFAYRLTQEAMRKTIYAAKDGEADRRRPLPLSMLLVAGAISGAVTSLVLTPIELVKCQLQVPTDSITAKAGAAAGAGTSAPAMIQRNPLTVIAAVYRHNGLMGFWHGQLGTLIRETGGGAAWFGGYEGVTALFRKRQQARLSEDPGDVKPGKLPSLPIWQQMVAGACAGVSYNFLFYPADTIKSRMQTAEMGGNVVSSGVKKPTFWTVGKLLWAEQGLKGMYRGCGITVARSCPASAFIFTVNETLRNWFG